MAQYRVIWEIDIEADSAQEAAERARAIQLKHDSMATVFTVESGADGTVENIDLLDENVIDEP